MSMRVLLLVVSLVLHAACSGGTTTAAPTSPTTTAPSPTPSAPAQPTITITATGMTPLEITIAVGQRVTFVNNDSRAHDVVGGVDPANPECPEILQAGFLAPGQSRDTAVFTTARICNYHDHTALGVPAFSGRIIIR